ncbi:MAG: phosphate ABC transporter permease PstA [Thermoanaerobaculia bacterium]|jgi:phosphate transport system permease protein
MTTATVTEPGGDRAVQPVEGATPKKRERRNRPLSLAGRGEPFVWGTGAGLAVGVLMILGLLALVLYNGVLTFWPKRVVKITMTDGKVVLGEVTRGETYRVSPEVLEALPGEAKAAIGAKDGYAHRRLIKRGNYDLYGDDFVWVSDYDVAKEEFPRDAWTLERREWGGAFGVPAKIVVGDGKPVEGAAAIATSFDALHDAATARYDAIRKLEKDEIGDINYRTEAERLKIRRVALRNGESSPEHQVAIKSFEALDARLKAEYEAVQTRIEAIRSADEGVRFEIHDVNGTLIPQKPSDAETPMALSHVVRAYPANAIGFGERVKIYLGRWVEFLVDEPREANTEGGVFPAIFGTFMMTVLMSLAVAPFGVIAALYLREYAKQGPLVSAVRIAVNNLAGVPSIVFGVFGLGFFCYVVGARIDELFYAERLPSPTFGTGGILWASLTLALLTVPVVIVSTEEALAAVPRSMREGSYACGASRWQTIWRIVIPKATPGIMTGLILAMARGAGEVAPLMITGVVKLAPELPFDWHAPFFHLNRSFMHLGFHIYDVGFQSRNSEAGKPMVYTTTLLLIGLIALLNMTAIYLRNTLRKRYKGSEV